MSPSDTGKRFALAEPAKTYWLNRPSYAEMDLVSLSSDSRDTWPVAHRLIETL